MLIDGCDGTLELVAGEDVDIHLDSSVKEASIKGFRVLDYDLLNSCFSQNCNHPNTT